MDNEEIKKGARNNRMDQQRVQDIHDLAVSNGAMCMTDNEGKHVEVDEVVAFGSPLKAIKLDDGSVKFVGPLVSFGSPEQTDLTRDFFNKSTDYGDATESDVYFNHRLPIEIDGQRVEYKSKMGRAKLTPTDEGIIAEVILKARNAYEKAIIDAGLAGALGWSSGTAGHLVDREQVGKAWHIKTWILGLDASLTPTPAEPRNSVIPLKSLITSASGMTETDAVKQEQPKQENNTMNEEEKKALLDEVKSVLTEGQKTLRDEVKAVAKEAAKEVIDNLPEVKAAMNIQITEDPADRPFKSLFENLNAVKTARLDGAQRAEDKYPRLKYLNYEMKANGASEGVPQDGGSLLDPTLTAAIIKPMNETGSFTQYLNPLPVSGNSNSGWVNGVDETSRVTGSRWGGIQGYRMAEAATLTKSKPTFRRIQWELKKYAALVVATDELLADSAQFDRIVSEGVGEELNFMVNDDIMNGLGLAGPQGFMNSGALITVTRDSGSKILGTDISAMYNRMSVRSRNNAVWFIGNDSQPQLDALFAVGSTAVLFPYASITPDGVKRLYNRPIVTTEYNATLNTTGDIAFCDLSAYLFWQKEIQSATSIHVYFTTDEFAWRFTYRADGKSAYASALTPYKGSTTTSPFVVLGSAT